MDIGNTRIKWACADGAQLGTVRAAHHAGWTEREFERVIGAAAPEKILAASVAGPEIARALRRAARRLHAPAPQFLMTRRHACGVTVGYLDPWRLGIDRLLAMIGARARFSGRPLCVVSIGTAMTLDLVGPDGGHRGGSIIPAPPLMVSSLLSATQGIRGRARGGRHSRDPALFGRSTRAALHLGARYAAAAAVDRAVFEGHRLLGRRPRVVLTGGGVPEVQPLIRAANVEVPDLVLWGLAVWAQEG
jgi:type III pantothenate kinase